MLRWTAAGAVSEPTAVQIRIAPSFAGRIRAGAPLPARSLTADEVLDNLRWFLRDRVGPRTPACTRVVLSGVERPDQTAVAVAEARSLGAESVVWHLGSDAVDEDLARAVDVLVRVARGPWDLDGPEVSEIGAALHVVVPLEEGLFGGLDRLAQWLVERAPDQVVFQWPFPGAGALPPSADRAAAAVRSAVSLLDAAGIAVGVKGLPTCVLATGPVAGRWTERAWRSANRWYVDAEHQREQALMFFPDLVRMAKVDACRFCSVGSRCEGVVEDWLGQGLVGVLTPLRE